MLIRTNLSLCAILIASSCSVIAQPPSPSPEHKVLEKDVGTWKATIKVWMGPDGRANSSVEPMISNGKEVNKMMGKYWLVSQFTGEFAGAAFEGRAMMGYDPKAKQFVGSWIDTSSPHAMHMSGEYDAETDTLTTLTEGVSMTGETYHGKSVAAYQGDDKRVVTMYELKPGTENEYIKSMEIVYERAK